ncbi:MAG: AAA family ATPase [Desulfohalobiaceae bacterium]|nr:AAA family ATPase [Desulfohalobiaceae bacterium]
MLEFLRIQNLALIQDLEIEFAPGLNVLTGESGAGKSFVLRALDFILGEKLQSDMVRQGKDKARVEAVFVLPEEEYLLRREITARTGRSRLYLNDDLISQEKIRSLKNRLIIHTSQHSQQRLLSPGFHQQILDGFLDRQILEQKDVLLQAIKKVSREKEELNQKLRDLQEKRELLEHQAEEIEQVAPVAGEEEELEQKKYRLKNQARIRKDTQDALDILHNPDSPLLDNIRSLQHSLGRLALSDEEFAQYGEQLEDIRQFFQDLDTSLRQRPDSGGSEQELEDIESRLFALSRLQRRLNRTMPEIMSLKEEIEANLSFLDRSQLEVKELERREEEARKDLEQAVASLNSAREQAGKKLAGQLQRELWTLGFSKDVEVNFEFTPVEIFSGVFEQRARLQWIPNPGQASQPLDKIASGGELSRFLLALVGLLAADQLPSLLFDEVDAGIGGIILGQVGQRISELSRKQQIILITHWPQLAAGADRHFHVHKEVLDSETFTRCRSLSQREIRDELSRMAGGGEQGQVMAGQLLEQSRKGSAAPSE